ncbi:MAG: hypothetical protein HFJ17_03455 [Clostridia bacterium]|nr:hypothetical protein [Clostridia bacterium]
MENITDALYMAGAILIFVIALTVSMSSFTTMRSQIDSIVEMDQKIDMATDGTESSGKANYLNYINTSSTVRTVGIETLVSSMYRVAKENYVVYIKASGLPDGRLMELKNTAKDKANRVENQSFPNSSDSISADDRILYIDINGKNSNIDALLEETYNTLARKKFREYLGVYQENTEANEVNRTTYRVITYVEI